jgi:hypothetical protein
MAGCIRKRIKITPPLGSSRVATIKAASWPPKKKEIPLLRGGRGGMSESRGVLCKRGAKAETHPSTPLKRESHIPPLEKEETVTNTRVINS